jgi:glycosyltransferase involved in cell wall biosynthesis
MSGRWIAFMSDLGGGGAQRTLLNVLRYWPEAVPRPLLVLGSRAGAGNIWLDENIETVELGRTRVRQCIGPLRRLLQRERPTLLFATMAMSNVAAAVACYGLPARPKLVLSEVNSHRKHEGIAGWQRPLIGWALRRADRIITQSHGLGDEIASLYGIPRARVVGIHNPIDIAAVRQAARDAAGTPPWEVGGPVIVAIGRLVRQKGFDILLRSFARIEIPGSRLAILGEGPERAALTALADELGIADRLMLPGYVTVPEAWLANASVFVLSSRWEGFGNVVVEALACGAPVVATDCPHGPGEIVRHEHTGLLVPPEDVDALAAAMRRMLTDRAFARGCAEAAQGDIERFAAPRIAGLYADAMAEALAA